MNCTKKEDDQALREENLFAKAFTLSLILLCQNEDDNSTAQCDMELRCLDVLKNVGYDWDALSRLDFDPDDLATLAIIFEDSHTIRKTMLKKGTRV